MKRRITIVGRGQAYVGIARPEADVVIHVSSVVEIEGGDLALMERIRKALTSSVMLALPGAGAGISLADVRVMP